MDLELRAFRECYHAWSPASVAPVLRHVTVVDPESGHLPWLLGILARAAIDAATKQARPDFHVHLALSVLPSDKELGELGRHYELASRVTLDLTRCSATGRLCAAALQLLGGLPFPLHTLLLPPMQNAKAVVPQGNVPAFLDKMALHAAGKRLLRLAVCDMHFAAKDGTLDAVIRLQSASHASQLCSAAPYSDRWLTLSVQRCAR
jgi:hypothetical protein